ncbi:MAG TPA: hypothetical protein PLJ31_13535, partial [Armatimonadota bacterium]|nr:hypothetical protein [Armatimonadota bacterium]
MADPERPRTPNEELAAVIAEALAQEGLVPPSRVSEIRGMLASGRAKESDWSLWMGPPPRPKR